MNVTVSPAIRVSAIAPSATNPRKSFDEAALGELASSIGKHGVLQPVVVRPAKVAKGKKASGKA